jgi:hypothetical protein
MDDSLLDFLVQKRIPTFSMSSGLTLGDFGWGTPTFHKMVRWLAPYAMRANAAASHICNGMCNAGY